jgi:2,4-dienoyl-CoA reductase-like NADH-dependent reductase (Old Yellow Enzyme family)
MAKLFEPFQIRDLHFKNRICVSPMSQYKALNGYANDWHFAHLSRFALGGCATIFTEATGVSAEGRRTHGDLGLWEDAQIVELKGITHFIHQQNAIAGVQLAHAGRKASERRPWHGETPVNHEDIALRNEAPWQALSPTAEPYGEAWPAPKAMTETDIKKVIDDFGTAARRADEAGFDAIEVYAAHGFLLHQFYSPLCNTREDSWGGSFENRVKLSVEVAKSIRQHWPDKKALFFRISATEWLDDGWDIKDSVALAKLLKSHGVDLIDCSSGGIGGGMGSERPMPRFPLGPAFQADLAKQVRREADIATMAVGLIWQAQVAENVVASGQADLIAMGRELLNNPNWTLHAAMELEVDPDFRLWDDAMGWWLKKRKRLLDKLAR